MASHSHSNRWQISTLVGLTLVGAIAVLIIFALIGGEGRRHSSGVSPSTSGTEPSGSGDDLEPTPNPAALKDSPPSVSEDPPPAFAVHRTPIDESVRAPRSLEEKELMEFLADFLGGEELETEIEKVRMNDADWQRLLAIHEGLVEEHERVNADYLRVVAEVRQQYMERQQYEVFQGNAPKAAEREARYPGQRVLRYLTEDKTYLIPIPRGAEPRLEEAWQAKDEMSPVRRAAYARFLQQHAVR